MAHLCVKGHQPSSSRTVSPRATFIYLTTNSSRPSSSFRGISNNHSNTNTSQRPVPQLIRGFAQEAKQSRKPAEAKETKVSRENKDVEAPPPTMRATSSKVHHQKDVEPKELPRVVLGKILNPQKVVFGTPTRSKAGVGQFLPINYSGTREKLFVVQTPPMRLPFGISKYSAPDNKVTYTMQFSFDDMPGDPDVKAFYDNLRAFDEHVVEKAKGSISSWFHGKSLIPAVVEANYKRSVREPQEDRFSPLMRAKVLVDKGGHFLINAYENKEPIDASRIDRGCKVVALLQMSQLWFIGNTFGPTWRVLQCNIVERGNILPNYAFEDDVVPGME